jgi:hypothetical protein
MPTYEEVPGSISTLSWDFPLLENYFTVCTDKIFQCSNVRGQFCPMLSLEEAPALCLPQVRGDPPAVSMFLYAT